MVSVVVEVTRQKKSRSDRRREHADRVGRDGPLTDQGIPQDKENSRRDVEAGIDRRQKG